MPFARSAERCTPQIARASNFSPRDRSLHGATSWPAYTVFGHAKSFRLCALRSLGLSLACTLLRRAESQEFLDAGPENLTNNAATGRAETTYGASALPTAGPLSQIAWGEPPSQVVFGQALRHLARRARRSETPFGGPWCVEQFKKSHAPSPWDLPRIWR